jgi:hypothetical protein
VRDGLRSIVRAVVHVATWIEAATRNLAAPALKSLKVTTRRDS